jgi:DNA-binding MarR family transcriptional regulator
MRSKRLRLMAAGTAVVQRGLNGHDKQVCKIMAGLGYAQRKQLRTLLNAMEEHLLRLVGQEESRSPKKTRMRAL